MTRISIKLGDIFSVNLTNGKKYFQYVADDLTQLNSNVIRAFKRVYPLNQYPELSEITQDQCDFHAHCIIKFGLKLGLWEKVGNYDREVRIEDIWFRNTNDYGTKAGNTPVKLSTNWYVWKINDKNFTKVGRLEGNYRNAEIGIVVIPQDIVDRMQDGHYHFAYPSFE